MNVPPLSRTIVTPTPCVQTPKGPMFVAAAEDLKGTEGTVQVYTINPSMRRHFFQSVTSRESQWPNTSQTYDRVFTCPDTLPVSFR